MHNYYYHFYLDTLAAARKAPEDSEYDSTTDKPLGRGLRSKRLTAAVAAAASFYSKNNKVSDSSDEDSDNRTTKKGKEQIIYGVPLFNEKIVQYHIPVSLYSFSNAYDPTIPAIQKQRKIPFVEKIPSSVPEMNGINNDQSVIQEHFERESRTTGSEYNKNNQNHVLSDLENDDDDDDDNRFNVLNGIIISSECFRLLYIT